MGTLRFAHPTIYTTPTSLRDEQHGCLIDFRSDSKSVEAVHRCPTVVAFRIAAAPLHFAINFARMETRMPGNRNIMYLIIGALIVAVGVLGYNLYQTKKEPDGLQINVGPNGLKIQNK